MHREAQSPKISDPNAREYISCLQSDVFYTLEVDKKEIFWGEQSLKINKHNQCYTFGEGNGNPLQCSCLENPRDGGAWWAAVSGVAQSRTRLKRLSSSSSSSVTLSN